METSKLSKDSLSPSDSASQGDLSSTPVALRTRLNSTQISYRDAALIGQCKICCFMFED
ncbi:hypothetical protein NPIL_489221, partial [Nephila pilipes]